MNTTLQDIERRAWEFVDSHWDWTKPDAPTKTHMFKEKFAELIIRECALKAAMFSINKNDIHPDIKWDDMSDSAKIVNHTTCQMVAIEIKEHFGIE